MLTEIDDIRNRGLPRPLVGRCVSTLISKYIKRHLPASRKVSNPDVYVDGVSTEFDLLVVRAGAQLGMGGYDPSEVQVVLEMKTAGIIKTKQGYPLEIQKISEKFDKVKVKNIKIWGTLLMCYGTIHPIKQTSINYEKIRKDELEPYNYGIYTLGDSKRDVPEWGKWEEFIKELLSKLN